MSAGFLCSLVLAAVLAGTGLAKPPTAPGARDGLLGGVATDGRRGGAEIDRVARGGADLMSKVHTLEKDANRMMKPEQRRPQVTDRDERRERRGADHDAGAGRESGRPALRDDSAEVDSRGDRKPAVGDVRRVKPRKPAPGDVRQVKPRKPAPGDVRQVKPRKPAPGDVRQVKPRKPAPGDVRQVKPRKPAPGDVRQVEPRRPASNVGEKKPASVEAKEHARDEPPVTRAGSLDPLRVLTGRRPAPAARPGVQPPARSLPELRPADSAAPPARTLYTLPNGNHSLKSDNYPGNYANDKQSFWTMVSEAGGAGSLTITCSDFLLEEAVADADEPCQYDFLSINGLRFCGSDAPRVTASRLMVEFHSDATVTERGFSCQVEVKDSCCGRVGASRIVGGAEVPAHSLPWQVALSSPSAPDSVFCGGSVLNSRYVLTAAHCTDGQAAADILVTVGLHRRGDTDGARRVTVAAIHQHAGYSGSTLNRDISLLQLGDDLVFGDTVRPACLPRGGDPYEDVDAVVSGWGALQSNASGPDVLHSVTVHTMTNAQCAEAYGASRITKNMLCAHADGKDSCQGDSGGPLVHQEDGRFTQVGVVSFGIGCAHPEYPGVYVRLTEMLDWLDVESADGQGC